MSIQLRLTTVFLRLSSPQNDCLPDVSINHVKNEASNPKKKRKALHTLRRFTTVFLRLSSPQNDCLPDVSINHVKNEASNPKKKRKALQHLKGHESLRHSIRSNSFKLGQKSKKALKRTSKSSNLLLLSRT